MPFMAGRAGGPIAPGFKPPGLFDGQLAGPVGSSLDTSNLRSVAGGALRIVTGGVYRSVSTVSVFDASQSILVVSNSSDANSPTLANSYVTTRPLFSAANTLALTADTSEITSAANYTSQIETPVLAWLVANPLKPIPYIVLVHGLATRTSSAGNSVAYRLRQATGRYVVHLAMGSATATQAYITRLAALSGAAANGRISGRSNGKTASQWWFADTATVPYNTTPLAANARTSVLAAAPAESVNYSATANPTTMADAAAYLSWGVHGGLAQTYPADGSALLTGSPWALIQTGESYNGELDGGGGATGDYTQWFASGAWGASAYECQPAGAVGYVEEPSVAGLNTASLFGNWAAGQPLALCGWLSSVTPYQAVFGDPLVAL